MTDAYSLAKQHLDAGIAEAQENNIDSNVFGQALIWKIFEVYRANGRNDTDIMSEVEYTLENLDDDGIFHVHQN